MPPRSTDGRYTSSVASGRTYCAINLNDTFTPPITWNTVYIAEVLRQLRAEGHAVSSDAVAHLAPTVYGHINRYGKYRFDVPLDAGQLRRLRQPAAGP